MRRPDIIKVDLSQFADDKRLVQIPGKLVLADNLKGEPITAEDEERLGFPAQVTMTIFLICIKGQIEVNIDLHRYLLNSGDTAIVLPGSFFQIDYIQQDTRCIIMGISPTFVNLAGNVKTGIEFSQKLKKNPTYRPNNRELEENIHIYKLMRGKLRDEKFHYKEEVAQSYIRIMQCNIFNKFVEEGGSAQENIPAGRKEELFVKFLALVKEHYMESRTISFYASKLFVSAKYLSSVVHEVSGSYASEWIDQHVILEAKAMLRTEGVSIKDVSNKLNFANQSFFAKFFKQHTGYTPKEYRVL